MGPRLRRMAKLHQAAAGPPASMPRKMKDRTLAMKFLHDECRLLASWEPYMAQKDAANDSI